ncbi:MAG TPA: TPM domain-containing protein [Thermoanaerobaculia bacterium]|nr:TPM domain-containing protein [Thermoanaerobaculia bacterium]
MKTGHFFSKLDSKTIVDAIGRAEAGTSGEIRVHVTRHEPKDIEARARERFQKLGMTKTARHNAVLFYIAPRIQKFQILGDTGVHEKCGDDFWKETAAALSDAFRRGDFTGGLVAGIEKIGAVLKEHFPHEADDRNELPDEVSED